MIRRVVFVCPTPGCHGGVYGTHRVTDPGTGAPVDVGTCHADDSGVGTRTNDGTPGEWRPVPCDFTWRRSEDWRVFRVVLEPQSTQELRDAEGELLCWPPLPAEPQARFEHAENTAQEWMARAGRLKP